MRNAKRDRQASPSKKTKASTHACRLAISLKQKQIDIRHEKEKVVKAVQKKGRRQSEASM